MELFYGNEVLQWKCDGCFKLVGREQVKRCRLDFHIDSQL